MEEKEMKQSPLITCLEGTVPKLSKLYLETIKRTESKKKKTVVKDRHPNDLIQEYQSNVREFDIKILKQGNFFHNFKIHVVFSHLHF
jgi:hypothetical protein